MNPRLLRWCAVAVLLAGVIAVATQVGSSPQPARVATTPPRPVPKATVPTTRPKPAATTNLALPATSTTAPPSTTATTASPTPTTTKASTPVALPTNEPAPAPGPDDRPISAASAPPAAPPPPPEVAIYGDSLTVLSESRYHEIADGEVDSHVHAFAGAELLDHSKIILADPINRLVLALGTNDAHRDGAKPWADFFNQLPASKCVVWPKPYEGSNEVKVFNAQVTAILAPHLNVHVIDWNARAQAHPEWIGPDHVHYTDEGRLAYADLLKEAALTCP